MTVVLLLCALMLACSAAWAVHRRHEVLEWHRELELAFDLAHRKDLPRRRAL